MSATIEQLTSDALSLPVADRAHLAHRLLQSLEPIQDAGVEAAWDAEVTRRVERVRQGVAEGAPAEDVFARIRSRYQK